jgi:hypothetical protein
MFGRFGGLVGRIIGYEAAIIGVVSALCLLLGWHSAAEISRAFLMAGILILAVGSGGFVAGPSSRTPCESHQYTRVAMRVLPDDERARQEKRELAAGPQRLIQGVILGGLTLGIAFVVDVL